MFAEEWLVFPQRYAGHLSLSAFAILAGLLVSIPLGVFATRSERLSGPILGVASIIQTIPGLALLALMVPVLGGRIGFLPAFLALWLYSILPILRNTIVGLQSIPQPVEEAALGVGMTGWQKLVRIDLPLAAPVIVAGLRTASVWVVGAATLSTPVGAESLGNYIFAGLQTRDWEMVLFGCLVSACLALALDQAIRLFEVGARRPSAVYGVAGGIALALICAPTLSLFVTSGSAVSNVGDYEASETGLEGQKLVIGAKPFTEQYILSALVKRMLEEEGARVEIRDSLGSTVGFDALTSNEIDVFIDYTGTLWATVMGRDAPVGRQRMYAETLAYLYNEHDVLGLSRIGFENAYAFAVRRETAEELDIQSVADLANHPGLVIGSDTEFLARSEWVRARNAYGLGELSTRGMDSTFMYSAIAEGEVDAIVAYTTDGRIDAFDLVLLEDPRGALPPYDAFLLLSPDNQENAALQSALAPLSLAISADLMRQANGKVDLTGQSAQSAADWLYDKISGEGK